MSIGDEVPDVVAVLCECVLSSRSSRLRVVSLTELVVYEATKEKAAISQKDFAECWDM